MPQVTYSAVWPTTADNAWKTPRDFSDLTWLLQPDTTVTVVDGANPATVGCRRLIKFPDGLVVDETLVALDDRNRSITYRINSGGFRPFKNFHGTITVTPIANGTSLVQWLCEWDTVDLDADKDLLGGLLEGFLQGALDRKAAALANA